MSTYDRRNAPERNNTDSFAPRGKQNDAAFVDNRPKNKLLVQLRTIGYNSPIQMEYREIGDLDYGFAPYREDALKHAQVTGKEHRGDRHTTIDSLNASSGVTKYMKDFKFHDLLRELEAFPGDFDSALGTVDLKSLSNDDHQRLWLLFLKKNMASINLKKAVNMTTNPALFLTKADRLHKNAQNEVPDRTILKNWYDSKAVPTDPNEYSKLSGWVWNAFFRQTSKLGIDFTAALGKTIHFNLTNAVYTQALDERRRRRRRRMHTHRSAITYSEMRHLRKLWDRNKAPNVRFQQNTYSTSTVPGQKTVSVQDVRAPFRFLDLFGPAAIKRIFQTSQWITTSREYELNLGRYVANGRPDAKAALQEGLDKMDKVSAKYHDAQDFEGYKASRMAFGQQKPTSAGQVGTVYATVRSVIKGVPETEKDPVNMREQMTAFYNAGLWKSQGVTIAKILTELRDISNPDAQKAQAAKLGIAEGSLADICDPSRKDLLETPIDQDSSRSARKYRSEAEKEAKAKSAQEYEHRGVPLSDREKAAAGVCSGNKAAPLTWREGICYFSIDETTGWGKKMKEDGFPTIAGGSGTAARLLKIYKWIGGEHPIDFRLALMGWMLPCQDHSLIEIMQGAHAVGVTDPLDKVDNPIYMYRSIPPLNSRDLRANVAKDAKFPDEHVLQGVNDAEYKALIKP